MLIQCCGDDVRRTKGTNSLYLTQRLVVLPFARDRGGFDLHTDFRSVDGKMCCLVVEPKP